MSEPHIDVLGQKLSYPTTWQGTVAVLTVCSALVAITIIAKGWATPEILKGLRGLNSTTEKQETINNGLLASIEKLSTKMELIETNILKASQTGKAENKKSSAELTRAEGIIKLNALTQQLELIELKGLLVDQSLVRLNSVAPVVDSEPTIQLKVQQQQQIQQQQQQIQQQLQQIQQQLQ